MSPCLLWSVPHGASAGNMLRTGVLKSVLDAAPDLRVVLLSPLAADPAFTCEFTHPRVSFETLPPHTLTGLDGRLLGVVQARYLEVCKTDTLRIRGPKEFPGAARFRGIKRLLGRVAAPNGPRGDWYGVVDRFVRDPAMEQLFDRCRPTLVATASPGLIFSEIPVLRTARHRRVPTMAVDLSWDNLTNKFFPARSVSRLVLWNSGMRDEAVTLHGVDARRITVAGVPQFDSYFRGPRSTREAFCERTGLDPARKIVTLATIPASKFPHHAFVVDRLIEAFDAGTIREPANLLIRLHPRDDARPYERYAGQPHVVVEKPYRDTGTRSGDGMTVDFTAENTRHLADTLYHSDVVLNVASTIAIEASIFDTPVINIGFDGQPGSNRALMEWHYGSTHFQKVVRSGAVRIAQSSGEMIDLINNYLANPAADADGRRRIVLEQCEFTDGRSAERVAAAIVEELSSADERPGLAAPWYARTVTPGTAPPGTTAPSTTAPGITAPGITAPGTTAPGITAPGITAPGITAPGITAPGITAPGTTAPGTTAPGTTAPGTTAPGTTAPGTTAPGTTAPGTTAPGTTAPGITAPGTTAPGTTAPGTTAPGTTAPGTMAPGTRHLAH